MLQPEYLLIIGAAVIITGTVLLYPGKGLWARLRSSSEQREKELTEDALKQIYNAEYDKSGCGIESLANALSISIDKAEQLLAKLEAGGLAVSGGDCIALTTEGRKYALKIIRVHRLYEKYLAEETGLKETEWHSAAEKAEHNLDNRDADELAARMANPLTDPHGDPIPSSDGTLPEKEGDPLTSLAEGETARIVHIEDEPKEVYSQIAAEDIHAGMQVRMIESNDKKVEFSADGTECILSPGIAENIHIVPVQEHEQKESFRTLTTIGNNESVVVSHLSKKLRGMQRRRLMDLGIVPGTEMSIRMKSPSGNPVAYNVRNTVVALRREQSDMIFIEEKGSTNE